MTDRRPDSVRADQRHRRFLLARRAAALGDGQSPGVGADILELAAKPQFDVGTIVDMGLQRCLQIGAVDDPIGGSGLKHRGVTERQAGDLAPRSRAHEADGIRCNCAGGKPRLQAEIDQHTARIGRELQAGTNFFQALGLLKHNDAKTLSCQCQRCRQSPDPGTRYDDSA
jgi:hypothetical protein